MKTRYNFWINFFLFFLFSIGRLTSVFGGIEPLIASIQTVASPVVIGTPTAFSRIAASVPSLTQLDHHVRNKVQLEVDLMHPDFHTGEQRVVVEVRIISYDRMNVAQSLVTQKLSIDYHHDNNYKSKILDNYEFVNAYVVEVELLQVWVDGTLQNTLPSNLRIKTIIDINRYEVLTNQTIGLTAALYPAQSPTSIRVSWLTTTGAEEYQLEYGYINNYGAGQTPLTVAQLEYDFKNNSTRITTVNTKYDIPLIFDQGWVYYRVRPVGVDLQNVSHIIYGDWSVANASGLLSNLPTKIEISEAVSHEKKINWQHATTFAEEGKRKDVITYYDGTLRNRQMVTRISSDSTVVIVGETIYDHQGRPTVSILPTPVLNVVNPSIKYYPKFNKNNEGVAYSKTDFDTDDKIGNANPLSSESGASLYYSSSNPKQFEWQAYVPESGGYPLQQVQYEPNGTGKIMAQGGVGPDFQLGSGKETRYLYGNPNQLELNQLFGSEVGFSTHYKKNAVVDANGQVSISYLDLSDKVIATALAGRSPENLNEIDNMETQSLTINYLDLVESTQSIDRLTNSINFATTFIVTDATRAIFDYSLTTVPFLDNCLPNLCVDCVYELSYSLKDIQGEELLRPSSQNELVGNFIFDNGVYYFHGECNENTIISKIDTLILGIGSYTISKRLKLHEGALDAYLQLVEKAGCTKTLDDFLKEELALVDSSICMVTCESCMEQLGTLEQFISNGFGTAGDYNARVRDCKALCEDEVSDCDIYKMQMETDMMPGGQYGEYINLSTGATDWSFPLSIFNPNHLLPNSLASWRSPILVTPNGRQPIYVDEQGERARIWLTPNSSVSGGYVPEPINASVIQFEASNNRYFIYPEQLKFSNDFVEFFESSWAASLLTYHPEYCFYEFCLGYDNTVVEGDYFTSRSFDDLLINTTTFAEAEALGFLADNQPRLWVLEGHSNPSDSLVPWDPFVSRYSGYGSSSPLCENFADVLIERIQEYKNINGQWYSMKEIAAYTARCGGDFPTTPDMTCFAFGTGSDTTILNREWTLYKAMYLSAKQKVQQDLELCKSINDCKSYNVCIDNKDYNPWALYYFTMFSIFSGGVFQSYPYIFDPLQPCSISRYLLYRNKTKRFGASNTLTVESVVNNTSYQMYSVTGQCPNAFALQSLMVELFDASVWLDQGVILNNYSHLNSLFQANNFYTNPGPLPRLQYDATLTGNTLVAKWKDVSNSAIFETVTLTKTTSKPWDSFTRLGNLVATGEYTFTLDAYYSYPTYYSHYDAVLRDSVVYDTVYRDSLVKLVGSLTYFKLNGCSFKQECTSNQLAIDLGNVMNVLHQDNRLLSSTPVSLTSYTSSALGTTMNLNSLYIKNAANTGPSLSWLYTGNGLFKIYDASQSLVNGFYLQLNDSNITQGWLDNLQGFGSIVSTGSYSFEIEAYTRNGFPQILTGYLYQLNGSDRKGIKAGDCDLPTPLSCEGVAYSRFKDMQNLIEDVLVGYNGASIDLFSSSALTPDLLEMFPYGTTYTTSQTQGKVLSIQTPASTGTPCVITFVIDSSVYLPNVNFTGIQSVSNFHVDTNHLTLNGSTHFYFTANYSTGSVQIQGFSSCLLFKECRSCDSPMDARGAILNTLLDNMSPLVGGCSEWSGGDNQSAYCRDQFERLKVCLLRLQSEHNAVPFSISSIAEFEGLGLCYCADKICDFINSPDFIIGYQDGQVIYRGDLHYILDTFKCSQKVGSGIINVYEDGCKNVYANYLCSTRHLSDFISASTSMVVKEVDPDLFFKYNLCECIDSYTAAVDAYINGLVGPFSQSELDRYLVEHLVCNQVSKCTPSPSEAGGDVEMPTVEIVNNCLEIQQNLARTNAQNAYNDYRDSILNVYRKKYIDYCLNTQEVLNYTYEDKQAHYTLYYYDKAGNLIKTIPPAGVERLDYRTTSDPINVQINRDRANGVRTIYTSHRLQTRYEYNSLNQLIAQYTPDTDPLHTFTATEVNGLHTNLQVNKVQMMNGSVGYLSGDVGGRGYLYQTNDGGKTWSRINNLVGSNLRKIRMLDAQKGLAIGSGGVLLYTLDNGQSWDLFKDFSTELQQEEWMDIAPSSDGTMAVAIVSQSGKIIYFNDFNSLNNFSIHTVTRPTTEVCEHIVFSQGKYYITSYDAALSMSRIYRWTAGTNIFESIDKLTVDNWSALDYPTPTIAYAVNGEGRLFKTRSIGANEWQHIASNLKSGVISLKFFDDLQGVALVGETQGNRLMRTVNGGKDWTYLTNNYYTVLEISSDRTIAMAVGLSGKIDLILPYLSGVDLPISVVTPTGMGDLDAAWVNKIGAGNYEIVVAEVDKIHYSKYQLAQTPTWSTYVTSLDGGDWINQLVLKRLSSNELAGGFKTQNGSVGKIQKIGTGSFTAGSQMLSGSFKQINYTDNGLIVLPTTGTAILQTAWNLVATTTQLLNAPVSLDGLGVNGEHVVGFTATGGLFLTSLSSSWNNIPAVLRMSRLNAMISGNAGLRIAGDDGVLLVYQPVQNSFGLVKTTFNENIYGLTTALDQLFLVGENGLGLFTPENTLGAGVFTPLLGVNQQRLENMVGGRDLKSIHVSSTGRLHAVGERGLVLYSPKVIGVGSQALSVLQQGQLDLFDVSAKQGTNTVLVVGNNTSILEYIGPMGLFNKEIFVPKITDFHFSAIGQGTFLSSYTSGKLLIARSTNNGSEWRGISPAAPVPSSTLFTHVWNLSGHKSLLFGKGETLQALNGVASVVPALGTVGVGTSSKGRNTSELYVLDGSVLKAWNLATLSSTVKNTSLVSDPTTVNAIHVFPNGDYIAVGDNGFYKHYKADNVLLTYSLSFSSNDHLKSISFHDNLNGVIVGSNGAYFKTMMNRISEYGTLEGTTWGRQVIEPFIGDWRTLSFSSPVNLVIGSAQGAVSIYDSGERYSNRFYYDRLGRLVVSRNERQRSENKYSYTLYDELGRVVEAGEKQDNTTGILFKHIFGTTVSGHYNPMTIDDLKLKAWVDGSGGRFEVTRSYYDAPVITSLPTYLSADYRTQQKRILHVTYEAEYDGDDQTYDHATHYKYDIHGNVKTLVQDNQKMVNDYPSLVRERFKRMDYVYDLVSGNVHRMSVQSGSPDQWHHAYVYYADNRIKSVYTSTKTPMIEQSFTNLMVNKLEDNLPDWQKDAQYYYYAHGPLARIEIGKNNLQGVDYYYTLQGWLKGVNGSTLKETDLDPGKDGLSSGSNRYFAKDVFGFGLQYYTDDYKAISGNQPFATVNTQSHPASQSHDLYNGNIRYMQTSITNPNSYEAMPMLTAYHYDQLNRLNESRSYESGLSGSEWNPSGYNNAYFNAFTFDAMGNILTQKRHLSDGGVLDDLTYHYQKNAAGKLARNRLYQVNDRVNSDFNETDIDDMGVFHSAQDSINYKNNYSYDAEGRLIKDEQESIAKIEWRVDGKVRKIIRKEDSAKDNLEFDYNAMGQRIAKHVYDNQTGLLKKSTYYILDAQGNQLSMYEHKVEEQNATYYLTERNIYGSSRLGTSKDTVNMFNPQLLPSYGITGNRNYELSNHLGNVLAVVSDNIYPLSSDNTTIDSYRVGLDQVYDYSPFGVQLDKRTIEPKPVEVVDTNYLITPERIYTSNFALTQADLSDYEGWFASMGTSALFLENNSGGKRLKAVSLQVNSGMNRSFDVEIGSTYSMKFDLDKGTLAHVVARIYSINGTLQTLLSSQNLTATQNYTLDFVATTNEILVQFVQLGTFYVDNFSLLKKNYQDIHFTNLEIPSIIEPSIGGWSYDMGTTNAWVETGRLNVKNGKVSRNFGAGSHTITMDLNKGTNSKLLVKEIYSGFNNWTGMPYENVTTHEITVNSNYTYYLNPAPRESCSISVETVGSQPFFIDDVRIETVQNIVGAQPVITTENFTNPTVIAPSIDGWTTDTKNNTLRLYHQMNGNVVTNKSFNMSRMVKQTFSNITGGQQHEFSFQDLVHSSGSVSMSSAPVAPMALPTGYDYNVKIYGITAVNQETLLFDESFNWANGIKNCIFTPATSATKVRIELSYTKQILDINSFRTVDNLRLRRITGNTTVYTTNFNAMNITASQLDGWVPDSWETTSATVNQVAGQYRLVGIGSGSTAKVQREFLTVANQEHHFQYRLSLPNSGNATVRVEQKVNGVYQYLTTQQTQTASGIFELVFTPSNENIRVSVNGTSGFALQQISLERDNVDTLVNRYLVSRGYRYGFNGMEKDNEVKGAGNSYTTEFRQYDPRLGRWLSLDPLMSKYPHMSPYMSFNNNPIYFADPLGLEGEPPGFPENPNDGDRHTDGNGSDWEYMKTDTGSDWVRAGGELEQAIIYPEKVKKAFQKDYERIQRNRTSIMGQFFGDGKAWQGAIPKGKTIYYDSPEMKKKFAAARENSKALEKFMIGYMGGSVVAPFVATTALIYAPTAFGIASDLTWKTFVLKAGSSAIVQAVVNKGDVNLAGVVTDGVLGFGSSALVSSAVEVKFSIPNTQFELNTLGNGISSKKFVYNSSVSIFFGAKSDFLGNQMKAGGINPLLSDGIANPLYQFSSNGLSNEYDKR